jgi:hypothetical protein
MAGAVCVCTVHAALCASVDTVADVVLVLLHFYHDAAVTTVTDIVAAASDCLVHQNVCIQTVDHTLTALR